MLLAKLNPVVPTLPEMVWGAISFFVLLIMMWAVCLPPIKKVMRQREEQLLADAESAERAGSEAAQVRRDYDATIAEARAEAARVIDEARHAGEARRSEIIAAVEAELLEVRQAAVAEIEADRQRALVQLRTEVGGLAVAAASKVVQQSLDAGANQAIVDAHVNQASGLG